MLISPATEKDFKPRVAQLLASVAKTIVGSPEQESFATGESVEKVALAAKIIRFMDLEDILAMYKQIAEK